CGTTSQGVRQFKTWQTPHPKFYETLEKRKPRQLRRLVVEAGSLQSIPCLSTGSLQSIPCLSTRTPVNASSTLTLGRGTFVTLRSTSNRISCSGRIERHSNSPQTRKLTRNGPTCSLLAPRPAPRPAPAVCFSRPLASITPAGTTRRRHVPWSGLPNSDCSAFPAGSTKASQSDSALPLACF
ncbi:hypothetical protein B0T26DRAFT_803577, partial [Lasiosphaeria miniovina]